MIRAFSYGLILAGVAINASVSLAQENNIPPWSMADQYYDPAEMKKARETVLKSHGAMNHWMISADRLEVQVSDEDALLWDVEGWYGGDLNKLWIKSEGEVSLNGDDVEEAEVQALWSRAISPFWDIQAGVRYDLEPKGRTHAVLGVQGLAPYWFEVDAAGFLSHEGDLTARVEVEYEILLSQTVILQPRVEVELSAQDIPGFGIGSGFSEFDAGLRLRNEVKREFAPYIGIEWQKALGGTADFIIAEGGDPDKIVIVAGVKTWF
jgi:copper resistance protein B